MTSNMKKNDRRGGRKPFNRKRGLEDDYDSDDEYDGGDLQLVLPEENLSKRRKIDGDRGPVYDIVEKSVGYAGQAASYTTNKLASFFGQLREYSKNIVGLSSIFSLLEMIMSGLHFFGKIVFDAVFSIHPNILGPIMASTISFGVTYVCGAYIGRALWPDNKIINQLYSLLTLGTNVSITGSVVATALTPIGIYKLASSFGDLADRLMLVTPASDSDTFLMQRIASAILGSTVLWCVSSGLFLPYKIITMFLSLSSTILTATVSVGSILSHLNLIWLTIGAGTQILQKNYKKALAIAVTQLFFGNILSYIFPALAGVNSIINSIKNGEILKDAEQVVQGMVNVVMNTPPPEPTVWQSIASYFSALVGGFMSLFSGPYFLLAAFLCASIVVIWVIYSHWERIKLSSLGKRFKLEKLDGYGTAIGSRVSGYASAVGNRLPMERVGRYAAAIGKRLPTPKNRREAREQLEHEDRRKKLIDCVSFVVTKLDMLHHKFLNNDFSPNYKLSSPNIYCVEVARTMNDLIETVSALNANMTQANHDDAAAALREFAKALFSLPIEEYKEILLPRIEQIRIALEVVNVMLQDTTIVADKNAILAKLKERFSETPIPTPIPTRNPLQEKEERDAKEAAADAAVAAAIAAQQRVKEEQRIMDEIRIQQEQARQNELRNIIEAAQGGPQSTITSLEDDGLTNEEKKNLIFDTSMV